MITKLTKERFDELTKGAVKSYVFIENDVQKNSYVDLTEDGNYLFYLQSLEGNYVTVVLTEEQLSLIVSEQVGSVSGDIDIFYPGEYDLKYKTEEVLKEERLELISNIINHRVTTSQIKQEGSVSKAKKYFREMPKFRQYFVGRDSYKIAFIREDGVETHGFNLIDLLSGIGTLLDIKGFEYLSLNCIEVNMQFEGYEHYLFKQIVEYNSIAIFSDWVNFKIINKSLLAETFNLNVLKYKTIKRAPDIFNKGKISNTNNNWSIAKAFSNDPKDKGFEPISSIKVMLVNKVNNRDFANFNYDTLTGIGKFSDRETLLDSKGERIIKSCPLHLRPFLRNTNPYEPSIHKVIH